MYFFNLSLSCRCPRIHLEQVQRLNTLSCLPGLRACLCARARSTFSSDPLFPLDPPPLPFLLPELLLPSHIFTPRTNSQPRTRSSSLPCLIFLHCVVPIWNTGNQPSKQARPGSARRRRRKPIVLSTSVLARPSRGPAANLAHSLSSPLLSSPPWKENLRVHQQENHSPFIPAILVPGTNYC